MTRSSGKHSKKRQSFTSKAAFKVKRIVRLLNISSKNFVLELLQSSQTPSPWRTFLAKNGQGVFHFCMFFHDGKVFQQRLSSIGVGLPYHVCYYPSGSYSYVDSKEQLGLELSVNHGADYTELIQRLLGGISQP